MSLERCESGYGKALDGEEFENNALFNQFQREAGKNLVNVNSFFAQTRILHTPRVMWLSIDIEFNTRFWFYLQFLTIINNLQMISAF